MSSSLQYALCDLRPLGMDDADMILEWRNDPRVRGVMFSSHLIGREEHLAWLAGALEKPTNAYFVFEVAGQPVGTVGFYGIDRHHLRGEWSFHTRPEGAPAGTGSAMGFFALDRFFGELGLRKLVAEVLDSNRKSLRMHRKLGFVEEGLRRAHVMKDGSWCDVYELAIFSEMWKTQRAALREGLFAHSTA